MAPLTAAAQEPPFDVLIRGGRIVDGTGAPSYAADLVVFDPRRIRDRATFAEPSLPSEGVQAVLVNGVPVLEEGRCTGAKPGAVLRGPGWDGAR